MGTNLSTAFSPAANAVQNRASQQPPPLPAPTAPDSNIDDTMRKKLSALEHEIFDADNARISNIGYAGGYLTGLIADAINKPINDKFNLAIDADPIKSWGKLHNIGAVDTDDWNGVLNGGLAYHAVLDNPLTNTIGNVGGIINGSTKLVENLTGAGKKIIDDVNDFTEFLPYIAAGAGIVALIIILK